jgi:predicted transcriptional regulator
MAKPLPLRVIEHVTAGILRSQRTREEAIRDAFKPAMREEFGYTVEDIAEAAGLTRERIYQIVKENSRGAA